MVLRIRTPRHEQRDRDLGPGHGIVHNYDRERLQAIEYLERPPAPPTAARPEHRA